MDSQVHVGMVAIWQTMCIYQHCCILCDLLAIALYKWSVVIATFSFCFSRSTILPAFIFWQCIHYFGEPRGSFLAVVYWCPLLFLLNTFWWSLFLFSGIYQKTFDLAYLNIKSALKAVNVLGFYSILRSDIGFVLLLLYINFRSLPVLSFTCNL